MSQATLSEQIQDLLERSWGKIFETRRRNLRHCRGRQDTLARAEHVLRKGEGGGGSGCPEEMLELRTTTGAS